MFKSPAQRKFMYAIKKAAAPKIGQAPKMMSQGMPDHLGQAEVPGEGIWGAIAKQLSGPRVASVPEIPFALNGPKTRA